MTAKSRGGASRNINIGGNGSESAAKAGVNDIISSGENSNGVSRQKITCISSFSASTHRRQTSSAKAKSSSGEGVAAQRARWRHQSKIRARQRKMVA